MFGTPSGIQMDALTTGKNEDSSPDWVWQSAGRIDNDGYVVEIRLPLQSIRFRSGSDVRMGVLFFRHNSRMGVSWSWPSIAPGQWVFESHPPLHGGPRPRHAHPAVVPRSEEHTSELQSHLKPLFR